ncbi:hypothetical protein K443DRAFT_681779 [Laccaria amethystina LaAM-08-1]|uniref:Uncharacterized protein n=1 Tax=Laccaria amethystina LaAM-08-1 TaxID=1095629 RepID=A0A0C9WLC1_9AGAR|nr:hypothetical protein K443DRAFT_681779 [Laccaria amethystina LaAM-08-1]
MVLSEPHDRSKEKSQLRSGAAFGQATASLSAPSQASNYLHLNPGNQISLSLAFPRQSAHGTSSLHEEE